MALPESAPPSRPPVAAGERDLDDAEFEELNGLLAGIPEPLDPLALDEADGFCAGIAVQSAAVPAEDWLRYVFDDEGHRWGAAEPEPEHVRASALLMRREAAIRRSLAEFGGFDPWLADAGDEADDVVAATVGPWLSGFLSALDRFPLPDGGEAADRLGDAIQRFESYLDPAAAATTGADAVPKPATVDAAVSEIVHDVFVVYDASERERYRVAPVQRAGAKVGRNDPCPCGSGKKFKNCHGAAPAAA